MASMHTIENPTARVDVGQHETEQPETGQPGAAGTDRTATAVYPGPSGPIEAAPVPERVVGGTALGDLQRGTMPGAGQGRRVGLRERFRYRRDLRTVEAFGIARLDVQTLDGKSLHQLADWVGVPSIWLSALFACVFSAELVALAVGTGLRVGWWSQTSWTLIGAAFLAWGLVALPLLIGFSVIEGRVDNRQDPFLRFGRSGSQVIRVLTMSQRSQLRRRTVALSCLREWHKEGERLGLDVAERFQNATTSLGTGRPITEVIAEVHAQIVPLLVTTIHGTFDTDKFPDREPSRLPRPDLVGKAKWFLGAPAVAVLIQIVAEYLT